MHQAVSDALGRLRQGAVLDEMQAAAKQAIVPLIREFEHAKACAQMVDDAWMKLSGETPEERDQGEEAVRAALAKLPVGAARREMERVREMALSPIIGAIAARQDRAMRDSLLQWVTLRHQYEVLSRQVQQKVMSEIEGAWARLPVGTARGVLDETIDTVIGRHYAIHAQQERPKKEAAKNEAEPQQKRRDAERTVSLYLNHIEAYLREEYEFDGGYSALCRERDRLREPIREALVEELMKNRDMDADDIQRLIEELVDEEL
jgi:hypothetical protein